MIKEHIASAFDRDLENVQAMIVKMGGLVENAIENSVQALVDRDQELAKQVRENDKKIDQLEEEVVHEAARVIALRQPIASDLRIILAVIKISGSLERSGDFAKNLAKRSEVLSQLDPVGGTSKSVQRMASEVRELLSQALDAFIRRDVELARQVRERDLDVDQLYNSIFRELLTHMMEDPHNITSCMHLHFISKNLERTGDHIATIADQVIYMVAGEMPADDRPKGDRTSFVTAK